MSRLQYHTLRVLEVVEETADARSIVFELPDALKDSFRFKPGQHLQLHVPCSGKPLPRCYSLSSMAGEPLRVTVKRVADGRASSWICAELKAGATLEVMPPAGVFTPRSLDGDFLMYAGGSGITPVFSIIRSVLALGKGRLRLLYANRDERSVIFGAELSRLAREHPGRLQVLHWLDSVQGLPTRAQIATLSRDWLAAAAQPQCFICGPTAFMDTTAAALRELGLSHGQIHIERFVSLPEDADDAPPAPAPVAGGETCQIEAELDGVLHKVAAQPGQLIIEALEAAGIEPPYSCRAGACAACMCHLEEGDVELRHNHVLSEQDMSEGWILACQAVPLTPRVRVRYPT